MLCAALLIEMRKYYAYLAPHHDMLRRNAPRQVHTIAMRTSPIPHDVDRIRPRRNRRRR
jgi:hypothetical protein